MKPRAVVLECSSYEKEKIKKSLMSGLEKLNFPRESFCGKKIILKPNLLLPQKPEKGITTHPHLVGAMAEIAWEEKAEKVIIGDTPGGPFNRPYLKALYRNTRMEDVGRETGAELNYNTGKEEVKFEAGRVLKKVSRASFIAEGDFLINLAKFKTHGLTRLTGGVKNLFGLIPGLEKADYHLKMSAIDHFAALLVDIARFVQPRLTIIDGVEAMEGNGPSSGTLKALGKIILADSAFAADVVMASIMGLDPKETPSVKAAASLGLPGSLEEIEVIGDYSPVPFQVPTGKKEITMLERIFPSSLTPYVHNLVQPRPVFDHHLCTGCGICSRHCPPDVISGAGEKRPQPDLSECIRCFCCQELCPYGAISIKRPLLGKLLFS